MANRPAQQRAVEAETVPGPEMPEVLLAKLRLDIPGYELLDKIAAGGQATVYRAKELTSGLTVAVKVLHGGPLAAGFAKERLRRETIALNALNHPNIVCVIESGCMATGLDYLVMNYIDGQPLSALWSDSKFAAKVAPEPPERLKLFKRICEIAQVAHLKGITHRDLSPSNILLTEEGEPFVLDFGLASTAFNGLLTPQGGQMSVTGQFLGKIQYAAPEQARGGRDVVDIRTDVYSLGIILYQIITSGSFPYEVVGNLIDVLNNIVHSRPQPPSEVLIARHKLNLHRQRPLRQSPPVINETIEAIVLKALEKNPADRYQSAAELAADLDRYLAGRPTLAISRRSALPQVLSRALPRLLDPKILVTAAVLIVLFGLFKLPRHRSNTAIPTVSERIALAIPLGTIDLLKFVDPARDSIRGVWELSNGKLSFNSTTPDALVEFPYAPPLEYDFQVQFVRQSGNSPLKLICCGAQDHPFEWGVGELNNVNSGFGRINGKNPNFNETTRHADQWIVNGQTYTATIKVRANRVEAYFNDHLISGYDTNFSDLRLSGTGLHHNTALGFMVYGNSRVTILAANVTEISGHGSLFTVLPQPSTPTLATAPSNPSPGRIDLLALVEPSIDAMDGTWSFEGSKLVGTRGTGISRIEFPYLPPKEYDYKLTYVRRSGSSVLQVICACNEDHEFLWAIGASGTNTGFGDINGKNPNYNDSTRRGGEWVVNDQIYHALVKVRAGKVEAYLDGKLATEYVTDYHDMHIYPDSQLRDKSAVGFGIRGGSELEILSAELVEISGKGRRMRPNLPARTDPK